nr:Chain C, PCP [Pseudomonas aeruginosa]8ACK_P Chain P, PCP [Pseudomonas aeruginosa]
ERWGHDFIK